MPPKCSKCGYEFAGYVCPNCGHDRRPDRIRIHWQICPVCAEWDDGRHDPKIMRKRKEVEK